MMGDPSSPEPEASKAPGLRPLSFRLPEEIGVIVALLVMIVVIGVARPRFLNPINLLTILGNTTFQGMLSLGMVFLLAIREIDLSVGWMFNFSAVVAALMIVAGVNPWLAALGGVGFGAVLGLVNGVLAIGLRLPSIIVTLGTYSMFEGLSLVANQGRAVFPTDQSSSFFTFASMKVFRVVPIVGILFVTLAAILHIVLHRTRFGYRVQAIGSNPEAARFAGIPIALVRVQTLVLMGAICGLSGALYVGFRGAIDPQEGADFALIVIAAVIIGGTPLSGGWGTVIGAVVGMLIIQVISSGIIFFGIDATWSTFVTGAVIVLAVALDQIVKRERDRALPS
jgi:ribose transport system permease protein